MKVTINGKEYPLTSNPSHGVVREVKASHRIFLSELLKKYSDKVKIDPNQSIDAALGAIIAYNPDELITIRMREDEIVPITTISLATGHIFRYEDFQDVGEREYRDLYARCREALGGDSKDFFLPYVGSSSSTTNSPGRTSPRTTAKKP